MHGQMVLVPRAESTAVAPQVPFSLMHAHVSIKSDLHRESPSTPIAGVGFLDVMRLAVFDELGVESASIRAQITGKRSISEVFPSVSY